MRGWNSVSSYYVLRGLLVRLCVLRAQRIISYRQRGVNPPTSHLPTPDPHLYASPGVKAPTEVTLITGLGRAPLQRHSRRLAEIPEDESVWKMCPLLTRYRGLSGLDNNDNVTALPERHFGNCEHRTGSDNVLKSFPCALKSKNELCNSKILVPLQQHLSPLEFQTPTHSHTYQALPACCLFIGRLSRTILPPPFLYR